MRIMTNILMTIVVNVSNRIPRVSIVMRILLPFLAPKAWAWLHPLARTSVIHAHFRLEFDLTPSTLVVDLWRRVCRIG